MTHPNALLNPCPVCQHRPSDSHEAAVSEYYQEQACFFCGFRPDPLFNEAVFVNGDVLLTETGPAGINIIPDGAIGDGVTDDTVPIQEALNQAEALGGGTVFLPPGGAYYITATLEIASNVRLIGYRYMSVLLSDIAGTFAFIKNKGWAAGTAASNISVEGIRFRRPINLAGNEGPFDGAIQFRNVDRAWVDQIRVEGCFSAVHFYGCTRYGWGTIWGYRQGDITLRINPDGRSAIYTVPGTAVAEESGYQLIGGGAVPEPSGPVGSGNLCTQDDVDLGTIIGIDNRHYAFETGDSVKNMKIARLIGVVRTAGRSGQALLANYNGVSIGECIFVASAAGTIGINATGDGVAQVQNDLSIGSVVAFDKNADSTVRAAVSLGRDVVRTKIGSIAAYGCQALGTGGGGVPLVGTFDIEVGSIYARSYPKTGVAISSGTGGNGGRFWFGRIHCEDGRAQDADPKQNAGVVFDGAPSTTRIDSLRSEDTRAGGARTQPYGVYNNASSVQVGDMMLTNNVTGQIATDGAVAIVANITASGTPEANYSASPGSTYRRTDGGAGTSFYVKEGAGLNAVGWVGK